MRHDLKELYTYKGKTYTVEALNKIIGKDITTMKYRELRELGCQRKHNICNYNTPSKASFNYYTINGVQTGWQFGEHTYFDTEEERDFAREEYKQTRDQLKYRNELLKKLQELSTEELEKIIKNI